MNAEEQLFAYKELKKNGQAFFVSTYEDADRIIKALTKQQLEEQDIGMFCPNCRCGVHKHIYNTDNKPFEVRFCPFCGEKLEWE